MPLLFGAAPPIKLHGQIPYLHLRGAFCLRETIYPDDETLLRLARLSHRLEGSFREEFDGYVYRLWLDLEDAGSVKPVLLVQSPDKDNFAFLQIRLIATLSELGGAFRN